MERKTKVTAEDGGQDLVVTRDFDLPVALLFRAYVDADIVAQWMGTRVVKLENKQHGGYRFETSGPGGQVVFGAHGVIHELVPDRKITRTFEMEGAPFAAQLEFLEFEETSAGASRLVMHIIYKTAELRDQMLKLPFAGGINMAHNRLQDVVGRFK